MQEGRLSARYAAELYLEMCMLVGCGCACPTRFGDGIVV